MTAPLAWLIDRNVVSEMMRPRPEPRVAAFLDSIAGDGLGLASVTVWEVLDGIGRLAPGKRRRGEALDDHVPDAFLAAAAAATRGLAVVTRNTGEFCNTDVETVDPWAAGPQ